MPLLVDEDGRVSRRAHVTLAQLQLGRVLDGHDPLVIWNVTGQDVEEGVLPLPEPPLTSTFARASTHAFKKPKALWLQLPSRTRSAISSGPRTNFGS